MADQFERQRTHLQRRKISAAIKVNKLLALFDQDSHQTVNNLVGTNTTVRGRRIRQSGSHPRAGTRI